MAQLIERTPYSYRDDPTVPDFDDGGPVTVMDGDCAVCSSGARIIARLDRRERFKICPLQSVPGSALARHYGLEPDDPETWLYLENGRAWSGMEAIIRIGEGLGGVGRLAPAMRLLPEPLRESLYRRIARNRYRFGRSDMCAIHRTLKGVRPQIMVSPITHASSDKAELGVSEASASSPIAE